MWYTIFQPGCVNTTEVDIKKACRVNKPFKSSRHLQLGVAGGRISPSASETDLASPTEAIKRHIAMLKQRLDRRNIKISKVAEA
jgi:regulator of G-protein signaling